MQVTVNQAHLAHLRKVTTPAELNRTTTTLLTKGAIVGENEGKVAAPVDKGPLRASMTHIVDSGAAPQWSRYGTPQRYGDYLDRPVTRNPHYRGGPRAGQPTKGWLSDTLKIVARRMDELIRAEIARFEATWRS